MKKISLYLVVSVVCCAFGFGVGKIAAQSSLGSVGNTGFKLGIIEIPADNVQESLDFYHNVLELNDDFTFAKNLSDRTSYHLPISHDGTILQINEKLEGDVDLIPWFVVNDIHDVVARVRDNGGTASDPFEIVMPAEAHAFLENHYSDELLGLEVIEDGIAGLTSVITDPDGNEFFVIGLDTELDPHFNSDQFEKLLDEDQVQNHLDTMQL